MTDKLGDFMTHDGDDDDDDGDDDDDDDDDEKLLGFCLILKASACCKHYVANEMESTTQADGEHYDRQHVESRMSTR